MQKMIESKNSNELRNSNESYTSKLIKTLEITEGLSKLILSD
ncbi:43598_t:CDS:1, partial [Gigaspora margarita]